MDSKLAINTIKESCYQIGYPTHDAEYERRKLINESCDYAIECIEKLERIEQQSCDDCVSRQAVLDKKELIELPDGQSFYSIDPEDVKALPPVTHTQCIATVRFSKEDLREICKERIEIECTHGTCKDCKHRDPEDRMCDCGHFIRWQMPRPDNWYCADFEKI